MDVESKLLAELDRRVKDAEEALQRQDNVIIEKDAEIERLKAGNARLKKWNLMTDEQVVMDLKAEIERKDELITKLCDALEWYVPLSLTPRDLELIQSARDATK